MQNSPAFCKRRGCFKGDFTGKVVVNQYGGYRNGVLYVVEDESLLNIGSTYLFATTHYDNADWVSFYPMAQKLISNDKNLSNIQLLELAKNDQRVKELQEAYKNEILLEADVLNNNALNSYQLLNGNK